MRIALVHSFYETEQVSGENVAVERQIAALGRAGHDVHLVARRTSDLQGKFGYKARAALTTATGRGPSPLSRLQEIRPDIVHVHNLFPNWGSDWLARWQGPVVSTLHNFRTVCARGTLARAGAECLLCPERSSVSAVLYRCYRDSAVASIPLAIATRGPIEQHPLIAGSDCVIVLSEAAASAFTALGLPSERLFVLPNFVPDGGPAAAPIEDRWLLAGRLSIEKGVVPLLKAWPPEVPLDVVGTGPEEAEARAVAPPTVRFLGSLRPDELRAVMRARQGLIFPSLSREHSPLVYLEALEAGLPVVALNGCWPADDVAAHRLGAQLDSLERAHLVEALGAVKAQRTVLSLRCRATFEERFSERRWVTRLLGVYQAVA